MIDSLFPLPEEDDYAMQLATAVMAVRTLDLTAEQAAEAYGVSVADLLKALERK